MSSSILTKAPVKQLYITFHILAFFVKLPFLSLVWTVKRPKPKWSFRECIGIHLVKNMWGVLSDVEFHPSTSLEPGAEGQRFVTIQPAATKYFQGPLDDPRVPPQAIGGCWFPRAFDAKKDLDKKIIIEFHGGAYVLGGVRPADGDFGDHLAKAFGNDALALLPQYRLAWGGRDCQFPAPIQDGLSTYIWLLDQGVSASNIIFSGNSAGGNLAIILLRYLVEHKVAPLPAAVLLWSPWVDLTEQAATSLTKSLSSGESIDWLPTNLIHWGRRDYIPHHLSETHPYITPLGNEFKTNVPIYIATGDSEVLYPSHMAFADAMRNTGSNVTLHNVKNAVHCHVALSGLTGGSPATSAALAQAVQVANSGY